MKQEWGLDCCPSPLPAPGRLSIWPPQSKNCSAVPAVASDKLKTKVSEGAIISADNLKISGGILSKPVALHAFRPLKVEACNTISTCIGENFKKVSEDWLKV